MKCVIVPVTPFEQNCSIFWDEQTGIGAVVDPGGDIDQIMAAIEHHKVKVEKLLVTHGHLDHAGATAELAAKLGVPVEGPQEEDKFWIDGIEDSAARYGFAGAKGFTPDRWLHHGDKVTVGGMELDVIHCPGHTPGHVTFVHTPSRLAFVGDVLFQGSIGRTDFPRGDHAALIASIRERLFPLGDDITFVPGHGPTSTFGRERKTNPFVHD